MATEALQAIGRSGEHTAAEFISGKGFNIIATNYRSGRTGEIDIIARRDRYVVFFEVKMRRSDAHGGAAYSINRRKLNSMVRTAKRFIADNAIPVDTIFRFDCILIEQGSVVWIEDICRNGGF